MDNKCSVCNKKIPSVFLQISVCKCKKMFCIFNKEHRCTYDYRNENKQILTEQLNKVVPDKVIKI